MNRLWWGLGLLRVLLAFGGGYMHPDEFFQGPEIAWAAEGNIAWIPWEFEKPNELYRTSWLPYLITRCIGGVGVGILRGFGWIVGGNLIGEGEIRVWGVRLGMAMFSFLGDWSVYWSAKRLGMHAERAVTIFALFWPVLGLGSRTLSNTVEMVLSAVVLWLGADVWQRKQGVFWRAVGLGVVVGVGFFVRFTFLAFAAPVGLVLLTSRWKDDVAKMVLGGGIGVLGSFGVLGWLDGWRFGVIRNLVYNLDDENLAKHGTHSRLTHLLVNLPMLVGPFGMFQMIYGEVNRKRRVYDVYVLPMAIVVGSVMILSLASHQEARFLMPLLPAVSLLLSRNHGVDVFGVVYHLGYAVFVAGVHQAGVLMALFDLGRYLFLEGGDGAGKRGNVCAIFVNSYIAPRFPLAVMGQTPRMEDSGLDLRISRGVFEGREVAVIDASVDSVVQATSLCPTNATMFFARPKLLANPDNVIATYFPSFCGEIPFEPSLDFFSYVLEKN